MKVAAHLSVAPPGPVGSVRKAKLEPGRLLKVSKAAPLWEARPARLRGSAVDQRFPEPGGSPIPYRDRGSYHCRFASANSMARLPDPCSQNCSPRAADPESATAAAEGRLELAIRGQNPMIPLRNAQSNVVAPANAGTTRSRWPSRRCFVPREFGLIQLELLSDRPGNTGPRAQALVVGFHRWPFREFNRRRRHRPVDHRHQVGIRDAEMVEQELAVLQIVLEIIETESPLPRI